jgi:hypothetical protein
MCISWYFHIQQRIIYSNVLKVVFQSKSLQYSNHRLTYMQTGGYKLDQNNAYIVAPRFSWHTRVAVGATIALRTKTT